MRSAVITVVHGRHAHLAAQRRSLVSSDSPLDLHVVVAMGDPALPLPQLEEPGAPTTRRVDVAADPSSLPLAAARNRGAAAALDAGADLLIFLDVDCLAAAALVSRYRAAARHRPDAVLCGPVTYLAEGQAVPVTGEDFAAVRRPHPARPDPPDGTTAEADPVLFWSLSFAVTADTWRRIGGFDAQYVGYGAEDTDFAQAAGAAGVGMVWVGGADACHMHHPTSSPPIQHVDAVLRNGARYAQRWGSWPMSGWLAGFRDLGLVRRDGASGWTRAGDLRVASVPARHRYVEAVRPAVVRGVAERRAVGWEPDPLFDPERLRAEAAGIDVVHVHFGFEHLSVSAALDWTETLQALGLPLVLTVHDLRNPHLENNDHHEALLRLLLARAAHVLTLTDGAAAEIHAVYGRAAQVIAHPTLLDAPAPAAPADDGRRTVLVPLGALRSNIGDPAVLLEAVTRAAAGVPGTDVLVLARPAAADDARLAATRRLGDRGLLRLCVTPREEHRDVVSRMAGAGVLVLPYRFGSHSGWIELARDTGTRTVVPDRGYFAAQAGPGALTFGFGEDGTPEFDSVRAAVTTALHEPRPRPAERNARLAHRELVRARHEVVYRAVSSQ